MTLYGQAWGRSALEKLTAEVVSASIDIGLKERTFNDSFRGVTIYVKALRNFNVDYKKGALATKGPFSVVRHPIYAAWILLIIPGFVLLFRSWLLLGVPPVAYIAFRALIHEEDAHLQRTFGQSYLKYRFRVNEMFPFGRAKRR